MTTPDPVLSAIQIHRDAVAAHVTALDAYHVDPSDEHDEAVDRACSAECEALTAMLGTSPATANGFQALASYLVAEAETDGSMGSAAFLRSLGRFGTLREFSAADAVSAIMGSLS